MNLPDLGPLLGAVVAFLGPPLAGLRDAFAFLLGGAGGVLVVWWLDGRRVRGRERRELIGALELVCLELAANIAAAEMWVNIAGSAPPLELHTMAWSDHQAVLARNLPRDLIGQLGATYYFVPMIRRNVDAAHRRGTVTGDDVALATRLRDSQQAVLRELQDYLKRRLRVRFTVQPIGPGETST